MSEDFDFGAAEAEFAEPSEGLDQYGSPTLDEVAALYMASANDAPDDETQLEHYARSARDSVALVKASMSELLGHPVTVDDLACMLSCMALAEGIVAGPHANMAMAPIAKGLALHALGLSEDYRRRFGVEDDEG